MKKYKIVLLLCAAALLNACKQEELKAPDFDVKVDKDAFLTTEDVVFNLNGSPDMITFYSGLPGREYDKIERIVDTAAKNQIGFTVKYNDNFTNAAINQPRNLSLFVSKDFNGKWYDSTSIRNANWEPISDRVTWPAVTSTAAVANLLDISDQRNPRDTLYVAFRYLSTSSSATSKARAWIMSGFRFNNIGSNGITFLNGISTNNNVTPDNNNNRLAGFNAYSFKGNSVKDSLKWTLDATSAFPSGIDGLSDEDWLISKPFKLSSIVLDRGVAIKKRLDVVDTYRFRYTTPGTYNATFVAINSTVTGGSKTTVKHLTIKIE